MGRSNLKLGFLHKDKESITFIPDESITSISIRKGLDRETVYLHLNFADKGILFTYDSLLKSFEFSIYDGRIKYMLESLGYNV